MGKKYVPSGYQILNLVAKIEDTTCQIIENDDSLVLKEILENKKDNKPLLISIDNGSNVLTGFATVQKGANTMYISLCGYFNQTRISYYLYLDGEDITGQYLEE